jgi:hypothetical protein
MAGGAGQGGPPVLVGERVGVEAGVEDGEQGPPDDLVQPFGRDGPGGEVLGRPSLGDAEATDVEAAATGSRTACLKSGATNPSQPQSCLRVRMMPGCWQA